MLTSASQKKYIQKAVGPNEQILFDHNRDILLTRRRYSIEEEIAKVASNNWPKATAFLLKKFNDEEFNVDSALHRVKQRIEYQLATVNDFDDYTDVLWALVKSKKYSRSGRSAAAAVAGITGRLLLFHYILKQGKVYPCLAGSKKRPDAHSLLGHYIGILNEAYSKNLRFLRLLDHISLWGFPSYKRNKSLFPDRIDKEPCYRHWVPDDHQWDAKHKSFQYRET